MKKISSLFKKSTQMLSTSNSRTTISVHYEDQDESDEMIAEIEENERYDKKSDVWGSQFLLDSDPSRFKSSAGESDFFPDDDTLAEG